MSGWRTVWAVSRVQLKMLRSDPSFVIIMFLMPLVVMPLFRQTMQVALQSSGYTDASGAEQVVPGQSVMFAFFVAGNVGFVIFREHGWKTWDRLRASSASAWALLAGFALPWVAVAAAWQIVLMTLGALWLGLRFDGGSPLAALAIVVAYSAAMVALMLLAAATLRTVHQLSAFQNIGAMVFAGLGGAIVPLDQLPGWARAVAPITPAYWAMSGFNRVFLEAGSPADVAVPVAVLLGGTAVIATAAVARFRADETKEFFA